MDLIRRALRSNPGMPGYHCNLAQVLIVAGCFADAIQSCRPALALRADYPEAFNNLRNALQKTGQLHEAIAAYRILAAQKGARPRMGMSGAASGGNFRIGSS